MGAPNFFIIYQYPLIPVVNQSGGIDLFLSGRILQPLLEPIFEKDPERLSFCTTIFIHPQFLPSNETKDGTKSGTKQAAPNRRTERMQLILSAIQEDPQVTVRALVEDLSISKNTILRILKELQENGTIKREGSSRKGRWVVL